MRYREFPHGAGRQLGYQMRLRVEKLVTRKQGESGLDEALLIVLSIDRAYAVHHKGCCSLFSSELTRQVTDLLGGVPGFMRAKPDARNDDGLRKLVIQQDLSQLVSHLSSVGSKLVVDQSMELVALFEMYMKYTLGRAYDPYSLYESVDVKKIPSLKAAIERCNALMLVPDAV